MSKTKKKAAIVSELCDRSPFCPALKACPFGAITQKKKWFFKAEQPQISRHLCVGCGQCLKFCPHGAIKFTAE